MILRSALVACLVAAPVAAQDRTGDVTTVLNRLAAAEEQLAEARGNLAQRQALSRAIRAYEAAAGRLGDMHIEVGQRSYFLI